MATTEDGAIGWELYRNSGFQLDLDRINQQLTAIDRNPVSERMYLHYTRLERRGFRRYVSINRLDTMHVPDPFLDESIRSRYAFQKSDVPTNLVIHEQTADITVSGIADALSDFGVEVVIRDAKQSAGIRERPFRQGSAVTIEFLRPPHTSHGTVDFVATGDPSRVVVGVRFRELTPVQALGGFESLTADRVQFVVGVGNSAPGLDVVTQDVYWLLQAIEASRSILNILLAGMAEDAPYSPTPEVESLVVASPLTTVLKISIQVFLFMESALEKVADAAAAAGKLGDAIGNRRVKESQAHLSESAAGVNDAYADYIREQVAAQRLTNERTALANEVLAEAADLAKAAIRKAKKQLKDPDFNVERVTRTALDDLVPALLHLQDRGLTMGQQSGDGTVSP